MPEIDAPVPTPVPTPVPVPAPAPAPKPVKPAANWPAIIQSVLTFATTYIVPLITAILSQYKTSASPVGSTVGEDYKKGVVVAVTNTVALSAIVNALLAICGVALSVPQIAASTVAVFVLHFIIQIGTAFVNGPAAIDGPDPVVPAPTV